MTPQRQPKIKKKIGEILYNRYEICRILGEGGQGCVYHVKDSLEQNVGKALKLLNDYSNEQRIARMKKEVKALQTLNSNYLIRVQETNINDYEERNEEPYFTTDLAKYQTLADHNYYKGEFRLCLKLFEKICLGVKVIHENGYIHRDLKPKNILLMKDEQDVCIGDFGLCYNDFDDDSDKVTKFREQVGSVYFAAPEQTAIPRKYTSKSDIYSLGCILYFLLTGGEKITPMGDYDPVTVKLSITKPHSVDNFIQKLTKADPNVRPDIENVLKEISCLLDEQDKNTKYELELTQTQQRILRFIDSYSPRSVNIGSIINYLADMRGIEKPEQGFSLFASPYKTIQWEQLSEMVENYLIQMQDAGYLIFERGEYRLKK